MEGKLRCGRFVRVDLSGLPSGGSYSIGGGGGKGGDRRLPACDCDDEMSGICLPQS